jgi:hypothetical protein
VAGVVAADAPSTPTASSERFAESAAVCGWLMPRAERFPTGRRRRTGWPTRCVRPPRGRSHSRLIAVALLAGAIGCEPAPPRDAVEATGLDHTRVALGASFVGGQAGGLRGLLHPDLIVQPPEPDTALRERAAADYLERLARETQVRHSELVPDGISREGQFLLERGTWALESGRWYRTRYTIRWRETPAGWKVVLWRWTRFR